MRLVSKRRLCRLGIHRKANRRRWFSPCRGCGLPLFGRNIPITSEQTLRVYWQRLEDYALEDADLTLGAADHGRTALHR